MRLPTSVRAMPMTESGAVAVSAEAPLVRRLAVIGVGLIGGSLAMALRRVGQLGEVVGCGRGAENGRLAIELGVLDRFTHDPAEAVEGADMVVLAVPLGAMRSTMLAMAPGLSADATVTDVGSAKGSVVADWQAAMGDDPRFVAAHPIAGSEHSGVQAAKADLFDGKRVILCADAARDAGRAARVRRLWTLTGAEIVDMTIKEHDDTFAATSHVPHMLAYALVEQIARDPQRDRLMANVGGGFMDFSRIASSSPVMWRDICTTNADAMVQRIREYQAVLGEIAANIEARDDDALMALFERAKNTRDSLL